MNISTSTTLWPSVHLATPPRTPCSLPPSLPPTPSLSSLSRVLHWLSPSSSALAWALILTLGSLLSLRHWFHPLQQGSRKFFYEGPGNECFRRLCLNNLALQHKSSHEQHRNKALCSNRRFWTKAGSEQNSALGPPFGDPALDDNHTDLQKNTNRTLLFSCLENSSHSSKTLPAAGISSRVLAGHTRTFMSVLPPFPPTLTTAHPTGHGLMAPRNASLWGHNLHVHTWGLFLECLHVPVWQTLACPPNPQPCFFCETFPGLNPEQNQARLFSPQGLALLPQPMWHGLSLPGLCLPPPPPAPPDPKWGKGCV